MKKQIETIILNALTALQTDFPMDSIPTFQIEHTRDPAHGDLATNIALILAKSLKKSPRDTAALILKAIPASPLLTKVEIAGPGFINFYLAPAAAHGVITDILREGAHYGESKQGQGTRIHIEFVSSNPTGPLHVGHGRGAAFGASVANLLKTAGYDVHREYYVNDAGRQMDILATSTWLRYLEQWGEVFTFPTNGYKGDYVAPIAERFKREHDRRFYVAATQIFTSELPLDEQPDGTGDKEAYIDALIAQAKKLLGAENYKFLHRATLDIILEDIRNDLAEFGVTYEAWFSEQQLFDTGAVVTAVEELKASGHCYEEKGALWFKSTEFGDEKDRVLVRENGQPTYFASDVAYHLNKFNRGFDRVIDVLGADHHGYVPRILAVLKAMNIDPSRLNAPIVQFATLYRGTERVQMSTRSGSFVTLRELRHEVGNDAARFFYVMRKAEQHMNFDLELAKSQSNDNPVYYIQYAHARVCSVMRQLKDKNMLWDREVGLQSLAELNNTHELQLIKTLGLYRDIVVNAATHYEPHHVAHYLRDLAHDFHAYYNAHPFLVAEESLRHARLCLVNAIAQVIKNGLSLLGVHAPETM